MEETNSTLYINNLNDKVNKHELKRVLYHLFCTYGSILEIRNSRSKVLRGQAFIVFEETKSATNAMRDLQSMNLLGKPMRINYAKSKSNAILRKAGIFIPNKRKNLQTINNKNDY